MRTFTESAGGHLSGYVNMSGITGKENSGWIPDRVWGRPRGTSAGLYRGLPYKPGHAYETNPRHRGGNRGSERRVREAEEDTREAEEDKE